MVMTGYAGEYSAETAIASGAREFINKPFSIAEFIIRFHKMMREHEILYQTEPKTKDIISNLQRDSNEKIGQPEGNSIVGRKDLTSTKEEIRNILPSENCKAPNFPESISQYLISGTHENQYRFKMWGVRMAEYLIWTIRIPVDDTGLPILWNYWDFRLGGRKPTPLFHVISGICTISKLS